MNIEDDTVRQNMAQKNSAPNSSGFQTTREHFLMSPRSFVKAFRAPTPHAPASYGRLPLMPSPAHPPDFHGTERGNVERLQITVSSRIPFHSQFWFDFCKTKSLSRNLDLSPRVSGRFSQG